MQFEQKVWHFGVLPFTGTGHVNPLIALSQEIKKCGHKVTFFERAKIEDRVRSAGLDFVPLPALPRTTRQAPSGGHTGILREIATLHFNLNRVIRDIEHYLNVTPAALVAAGVDVILINEIAVTGPTVAQLLNLPYFILSTSVPHNFGWKSSAWLTGYRDAANKASWLQTAFLEVSALRQRGPIRNALDEFRHGAGLRPVRQIANEYPCLAHITQLAACLDLPRTSLPATFHYTGPWLSDSAIRPIDFPWSQLDGRPLAYVTLGTTRNARPDILRMIAEACSDLDVQVVISLGNRFDRALFADLPGRPVVTTFAPQLELLKIAALAITHGGPNTAFEALMEGKPMVAIPLAYDQPAIGARLKRLHVAEVLPVMRLSTDRIRKAVAKILNNPRYREAAGRVQSILRSTKGTKRAADVIEVEMSGYAARQQSAGHTARVLDEREHTLSRSPIATYLRNE